MNYLAKYSITQCTFKIKNSETFQDIKFIGIFELTPQGMFTVDFSQVTTDVHFKRAICIESRLGGGIGFPMRERVYKIMTNDHADLINAFLDTIPEEKIVLFDDGERYASEIMKLIIKLAQKKGKKITCIGVEPMRYLGRQLKREFHSCWKEIELVADKSILFILPPSEAELDTMEEFNIYKYNEIWKYVYELWKKVNKQM